MKQVEKLTNDEDNDDLSKNDAEVHTYVVLMADWDNGICTPYLIKKKFTNTII